ncbi:hypothetical protein GCM10010232_33860 [Streptomyces amakusaensis]
MDARPITHMVRSPAWAGLDVEKQARHEDVMAWADAWEVSGADPMTRP